MELQVFVKNLVVALETELVVLLDEPFVHCHASHLQSLLDSFFVFFLRYVEQLADVSLTVNLDELALVQPQLVSLVHVVYKSRQVVLELVDQFVQVH